MTARYICFRCGGTIDSAMPGTFESDTGGTFNPLLSRYVLDGRYNIDNNGIENAIRPLALGRKNFLFAGNHDAAVRAAIVYSLFSCCKAAGIDTRSWLEDVLRRIPTEKNPEMLLPGHWTLTNR